MTHAITTTNEHLVTLYNLLNALKLDRVSNRKRWKFLAIVEKPMTAYEDQQQEFINEGKKLHEEFAKLPPEERSAKNAEFGKSVTAINVKVRDLAEIKVTVEFPDREVFTFGKALFAQAGENLEGRTSKLYADLEDEFDKDTASQKN